MEILTIFTELQYYKLQPQCLEYYQTNKQVFYCITPIDLYIKLTNSIYIKI